MTRETSDSLGDLQKCFQYLDRKYFNEKLSANGVQVKWSDRLTVKYAQTHSATNEKSIEIRLSRKLLESRPDLTAQHLRKECQKAYGLLTDPKKKSKTLLNIKKNSLKSNYEINSKGNEQLCGTESSTAEEKIIMIIDLQTLFKHLDEKYLSGILTANSVEINWFQTSDDRLGIISIEDGKFKIKVSAQLLSSSPEELIQTILNQMVMTSIMITNRVGNDHNYNSWMGSTAEYWIELNAKLKEIYKIYVKESTDIAHKWLYLMRLKTGQYILISGGKVLDRNDMKLLIEKIENESIVDPRLELLDPKPDIQKMFRYFDKRFFNEVLFEHEVEVRWSESLGMGLAGFTYWPTEERPIIIELNRQLLRFSERRNVVEILLHEMIHAHLMIFYMDDKYMDQEHGPEFIRIMARLNAETGANVTVYHNLKHNREEYRRKVKESREQMKLRNDLHNRFY